MTDKQIIIDGVDVAKCRCFTSEWDFNNCGHICKGTECKYKRLWYKKQLARKEQECEKLKEEIKINGFGCFNIEMSEQLDQLKAENEELKTMLKDLSYEGQNLVKHILECELNRIRYKLDEISECEVENDNK